MSEKGTVYFFTGLSGAGKTTIGGMFYRRLKERKPNVVLLDGDQLRPMFDVDTGYSFEERKRGAYRNFRLCRLLADQGIDVILCSISMYRDVRAWNREHIDRYREIYIKVSRDTLFRRDQKGLYSTGKNVIGIDLPFEEPEHPDVVVENDGIQTPEAITDRLERQFFGKETES